jgi:hypothetical protein
VWIDAFEYLPDGSGGGGGDSGGGTGGGSTGTPTRVEQTATSVTYTGAWMAVNNASLSGGSSALSMDNGSRATFTFNGTAGKWIGLKDPWSGIARVYVDGVFKAQVDAYSATTQSKAVLYEISGLASGSHSLSIEVTGTKNSAAQGLWVWVDAFEYVSGDTTGGGGGSNRFGRDIHRVLASGE